MTVNGQDWSSYQSDTPATAGIAFAFIKATEGTTYKNSRMSAQAAHARAAGLVVGFYHFIRPGDVNAQAAYFVAQADSVEGDPLFVDWEDSAVSCANKDAFIAEVKRLRGASHRVGLYCDVDFWLNHDTTSNAGDALWIADYNGKPGNPDITAKWLFHQWKSTPVDTNVGDFASQAALEAWANLTTVPPVKAPAKPASVPANTYTVKNGDTLGAIAKAHGATLAAVLSANPGYKGNPDMIHVGDKVKLPAKAAVAAKTYTIKNGDTLSSIATAHKTTVAALSKLNGIKDPDTIFAGKVIKV